MGVKHDVLDHGFIQLVDYMGTEESIVRAARVSYSGGTKKVHEDRGLLRYLMRHRHTTPFEMCEIVLCVKLPIFVARQWVRHRTANLNEVSARYSILDMEYYIPELDRIAKQSTTNKQGSGAAFTPEEAAKIQAEMGTISEASFDSYGWLTSQDVARELARIPMSINGYTKWFWKIDTHNLMHFLSLRCDPHAQYEIRVYADIILGMLEKWMPNVYEAFYDYRLTAGFFSGHEMSAIRAMAKGDLLNHAMTKEEARTRMKALADSHGLGTDRERKAFWERLGVFPVIDRMESQAEYEDRMADRDIELAYESKP